MHHLPNLLFVGPMKCGTSWIHNYLDARGDICLPQDVKETFYFDRHHDRGTHWYAAFFQHFNSHKHRVITEVAPSLFHLPESILVEIKQELNDIPIVITLRNPVKRAWSHFQHMRRGYTKKPIEEAIKLYPEIIEASLYSKYIRIWKNHFTKVSVLRQELLQKDPFGYADLINRHLNIPRMPELDSSVFDKSNEATVPASYTLAMVGRYTARSMRAAGLYGVVNAAKNMGMKRVFYGDARGDVSLNPSTQEIDYLNSRLQEELALYSAYSNMTGERS